MRTLAAFVVALALAGCSTMPRPEHDDERAANRSPARVIIVVCLFAKCDQIANPERHGADAQDDDYVGEK